MTKIAKVSRALRMILWVSLVMLPVLIVLSWVYIDTLHELGWVDNMYQIKLSDMPITWPMPAKTKVFGFLASMIPTALEMLILFFLIKLFSLYVKGEIFSQANVRYIRLVGYTMLISQAASPVYQALMTIALTISNPPGQRMISIGVSSTNFSEIVTALIIIVVAWIMDEGRKLKEEQALVI